MKLQKFEIKNRFSGSIIYQSEAESFSALVRAAVKARADLRDANLRGAENISERLNAESMIVSESGAFEGWKKCNNNVIVRVLIPAKAKRSNSTSRKCRASEVKVLEVIGATKGVSQYNNKIIYKKGKIVKADEWNEDRWVECGGGIHFFITRKEAEIY